MTGLRIVAAALLVAAALGAAPTPARAAGTGTAGAGTAGAGTAGAGTRGTATAGAAAAGTGVGQPAADRGPALSAATRAYLAAYPQLSGVQAGSAAAGQDARKSLYGELTAGGGAAFGGAWYDPPTGVLHVAATTPAARNLAAKLGARLGLLVRTHAVAVNFAALQREAQALRAGSGVIGRAADGQVGIDVPGNRVVAAVSPAEVMSLAAAARAAAPAPVALVADPRRRTELDAGCTGRLACDWTVRAGSALWSGVPGANVCSVGFTARDPSNQRYVYTAGHCSSGSGVVWGTGGIAIGPLWSMRQAGLVDASIIKVTNPWFQYDVGGEIYNEASANRSVPLVAVAPALGFIWAGDVVCLAANFTAPNGPNYCGVVGTPSDAAVAGMVRVDGLDGCPGDSGGGWYWLTSTGSRYGYGLHSRSDLGCHGSGGGSHSWFSPLPAVKAAFTPTLTVETT
jgi:streptogrisin C